MDDPSITGADPVSPDPVHRLADPGPPSPTFPGPPSPDRTYPPGSLPTGAFEFIAAAAVTGVIGQVSFELLKAAVRRRPWRLRRIAAPRNAEDHIMTAKYAVIARCAELARPLPKYHRIEVVRIGHDHTDRVVELAAPGLTATVRVPIPPHHRDGTVQVTLYTHHG
ncbi:hypothetical protein LX16_0262 [Stackebrandtia albiflava]|uniref:Uncharacterized protein n=1 Tax=Stackebrandtia albiflava TaxID=406432 RepID=A0A562V9T2_9ACTN|nr:hypothetical protein [Stackebrandtia albiflava]TWJ14577.1 hypothetical protein LX16_0262 [Stackebrandtia albiflava]